MKYNSLGMIETNGLVASLVAFDKMMNSGEIEFYKKEVLPNGHVVIFFLADNSIIKSVLETGANTADKVGRVIATGFVPFPNNEIEKILIDSQSKSKRTSKKRNMNNEVEKVETLFDAIDQLTDSKLEEDNNGNRRNSVEEIVVEEAINSEIAAMNTSESNEENNVKYDSIAEVDEENIDIDEMENITVDDEKNSEAESFNDESVSEGSSEDEVQIKDFEEGNEESVIIGRTEEESSDSGMSHLEKLKAEAIAEVKSENADLKVSSEENKDGDELQKMNVHELRKMARAAENFPIKGREISKANRGTLLEYFYSLKK